MAKSTEQHTDGSNNGHSPGDEALREHCRPNPCRVVGVQDLVDQVIIGLGKSPYNASMLYRPRLQHRFAEIRRDDPALYHGTLMQAVSISLKERAGAWDRRIEVLELALNELDIVPLSSIEREEIDWLWYPYIPRKKLTIFEGDPSSGKTYLLLMIAAAVTQGYDLPDQDGKVGPPNEANKGNVLYITAEDGLGDTLRPRAENVNADLDRLFVPKQPQSFSLTEPQALRNAMARVQPRLLVLDPLQAFLGAEVDMHRANEVRPLMTTLLALGIEYGCAIVAIRHWTKAIGGKAKYRGQGNVDFTAAARSVLSVGESPENETLRIMAHAKPSLSKLGVSIMFQIKDEGLEWAGISGITADELSAAQPQRHKKQRQNAMEWLRDFLRDGPKASLIVIEAAKALDMNEKALRRAKELLGVLAMKEGNTWFWRLPKTTKWERSRYGDDDDDHIDFS